MEDDGIIYEYLDDNEDDGYGSGVDPTEQEELVSVPFPVCATARVMENEVWLFTLPLAAKNAALANF